MIRTSSHPLHDWKRHYPTATRIAASIPAILLALRTRTLVADAQSRFGVAESTAMRGISMARASSRRAIANRCSAESLGSVVFHMVDAGCSITEVMAFLGCSKPVALAAIVSASDWHSSQQKKYTNSYSKDELPWYKEALATR